MAGRRLHRAALALDLAAVDAALRAGAAVDERFGADDEQGRTALHTAVGADGDDAARARVIARLLAAGAEVDAPDGDEDGSHATALALAAARGRLASCACLLDGGAAIDARDDQGWTPLHGCRAVEVAALLLDRGAALDAVTAVALGRVPVGSTPLDAAILSGRAEVAAVIEARGGARVTSVPGYLTPGAPPPLFAAIIEHDARRAVARIEAGDPLEARDPRGCTALLVALEYHEPAIARALVEHGASLAARDDLGRSAIHIAPTVAAIAFVLEHGVDVDARDLRGRRALHVRVHDVDVTRALLAAGAAPDAADDDGVTPLGLLFTEHVAHYALVARAIPLLEAGASARLPGAIALALVEGWVREKRASYRDALALLLRHGLDPDAADRKGWTALHEATYRRHADAIALLREAGARDDLATTARVRSYRAGTTAADVARDR